MTPTAVHGGIILGPTFTPEPHPATTPSPDGSSNQQDGGPGWFDIGGHVIQAIDDWFRKLVESALDPVLSLLGQTILATPDVSSQDRVRELWQAMLAIADGLFVLLIVVGGAIVMTHETLQSRYALKDILPRLAVGAVAANVSLSLFGVGVHMSNALAQAFLARGVDPVNATAAVRDLVVAPVLSGGIFVILVGLVVAVLAVVLLCVYVCRVAALTVLAVGAPLALACHALPQTEGLAQLWWRAVLGCFAVQLAQSLVLVTALRVFFDSGHRALGFSASGSLIDVIVCLCLLWMLVRIPGWVMRFVFSRRSAPSALGRVVKYTVIYKVARAVAAAL